MLSEGRPAPAQGARRPARAAARARRAGGAAAHMRFCTSTCFSLRSKSARIFCFSASTIRSFSMLNSSSVLSLISAAFSLASWWMNWTIWLICACTSISFMASATGKPCAQAAARAEGCEGTINGWRRQPQWRGRAPDFLRIRGQRPASRALRAARKCPRLAAAWGPTPGSQGSRAATYSERGVL